MRNFFSLIIKISISALLLIFLFKRIDIKGVLVDIRSADMFYFSLAVILFLVVNILGFVRWVLLLRSFDKELSLKKICVSHSGGLFFNVFLPTTIGGDVVRTLDLTVHTKDSSFVFATVFIDRICGFLAITIIAFLGFLVGYSFNYIKDLSLFFIILIFTLLVILLFLITFTKKVYDLAYKLIPFKSVKDYIARFHNCCYQFRLNKSALIMAILLSLLIQGLFQFVFYLIGKSLGIHINPVYYFILIPIINIASFIPISIGGLGIRDNVAVALFARLGVMASKVAAMTLLVFALIVFLGFVGGIIYAIALHNRRLQCSK